MKVIHIQLKSLRQENKISKSDGEKLLVFTNNAGPIFILGTIGIGMYGSVKIGFLLYFLDLENAIKHIPKIIIKTVNK